MINEIILIQHTETTTPGLALTWMQSSGRKFNHIRMHHGDPIPQPLQGQHLLLCGGGVHVDQESEYPWLALEKKIVEKHIALGNKVVGLCLGGQICAQILGAKVAPHALGWEVGWWDVDIKSVPGLAGFEIAQTIKFSQFHRYIFERPQSSIQIASNDWWQDQAFLWNEQVLSFQFHPERDLVGNAACYLDDFVSRSGMVQSPEVAIALGNEHQKRAGDWFFKVLDGFLKES